MNTGSKKLEAGNGSEIEIPEHILKGTGTSFDLSGLILNNSNSINDIIENESEKACKSLDK